MISRIKKKICIFTTKKSLQFKQTLSIRLYIFKKKGNICLVTNCRALNIFEQESFAIHMHFNAYLQQDLSYFSKYLNNVNI